MRYVKRRLATRKPSGRYVASATLRLGLLIGVGLFALTVAPGVAGAAPASQSVADSLHLKGPTVNKIGTDFDYTISGSASAPGDFLVAWEQYYPVTGCAATYAAESARTFESSTYELTLWLDGSVSGTFSKAAEFGADHPGKHGMCVYLISLTTGNTYAHAGAFWTNTSAG